MNKYGRAVPCNGCKVSLDGLKLAKFLILILKFYL